MLVHLLTNFEIQSYQNEPGFNGAYSENNLPNNKDEAHLINLDEYSLIGTHWIASYVNVDKLNYFVIFEVEHTPKEIKKLLGNKNITTSIDRIQANDSMMCGKFFIRFIEFMIKGKSSLD